MQRKFYKLLYQWGIKKSYRQINRLRYLHQLRRAGKNPRDEWDYSDQDFHQYNGEEVLLCSRFHDLRVFFYCNPQTHVEAQIIRDGLYSPYILDYMEMFLAPDTMVLDVGANIGAYAIPLAKAFADIEVHAFEPNPAAIERFRRNLSINRIKNIRLHECAVGAEPGRLELHAFSEGDLGLSSFVIPPKRGSKAIPVQVISLDEFFLPSLSSKRPVSFIKIDVQGFEFQVIAGARNLIEKWKPPILLEHEDFLFPRPAEAEEAKQNLRIFFAETGYEVFYLTRMDPFLLFPVLWDRPLFGNLIALPEIPPEASKASRV